MQAKCHILTIPPPPTFTRNTMDTFPFSPTRLPSRAPSTRTCFACSI
uniref:Uncharacterized protein n=1 Tax=Arundo donax TaxID=35708 RepID=A0A0A8Y2H5_ARUDO